MSMVMEKPAPTRELIQEVNSLLDSALPLVARAEALLVEMLGLDENWFDQWDDGDPGQEPEGCPDPHSMTSDEFRKRHQKWYAANEPQLDARRLLRNVWYLDPVR